MHIVFESDDEMLDYILLRHDLMERIVINYDPSNIAKFLQMKYFEDHFYGKDKWNEILNEYIFDFKQVIKRIEQFIK